MHKNTKKLILNQLRDKITIYYLPYKEYYLFLDNNPSKKNNIMKHLNEMLAKTSKLEASTVMAKKIDMSKQGIIAGAAVETFFKFIIMYTAKTLNKAKENRLFVITHNTKLCFEIGAIKENPNNKTIELSGKVIYIEPVKSEQEILNADQKQSRISSQASKIGSFSKPGKESNKGNEEWHSKKKDGVIEEDKQEIIGEKKKDGGGKTTDEKKKDEEGGDKQNGEKGDF